MIPDYRPGDFTELDLPVPWDTTDERATKLDRYEFKVNEANWLGGLKLVVTDYMPTKRIQFRFPRSKKKRIRRKWAKQARNFKTVDAGQIYQMGDTLIVSREIHERLVKEVMKRAEDRVIESLGVPLMTTGESIGKSLSASISASMDELERLSRQVRLDAMLAPFPFGIPSVIFNST